MTQINVNLFNFVEDHILSSIFSKTFYYCVFSMDYCSERLLKALTIDSALNHDYLLLMTQIDFILPNSFSKTPVPLSKQIFE